MDWRKPLPGTYGVIEQLPQEPASESATRETEFYPICKFEKWDDEEFAKIVNRFWRNVNRCQKTLLLSIVKK